MALSWLDGWRQRTLITWERGQASNSVSFYVPTTEIAAELGIDLSKVVFTTSDGLTLISSIYFGQYLTNLSGTVCYGISGPIGSISIYMYFDPGTPFTEVQICSAADDYLLCDDFYDESINASKWVVSPEVRVAEMTVDGIGYLRLQSNTYTNLTSARSVLAFSPGTELIVRALFPTQNSRETYIGFCVDTAITTGQFAFIGYYNQSGTIKWFVNINPGDDTTIDGPTLGEWFVVRIRWNLDGTMEFYIDDTLVHTDTGSHVLDMYACVYNKNWWDNTWYDLIDYIGVREIGEFIEDTPEVDPIEIPITADFSASVVQAQTGHSIVFTDTSVSYVGDVDTWLWDFGDGDTSTEEIPTHSYSAVGTYTVTLTVSLSGEHEDSEVKTDFIEIFDPTDTAIGEMIDDIAFRIGDPTIRGGQ